MNTLSEEDYNYLLLLIMSLNKQYYKLKEKQLNYPKKVKLISSKK